MTQWQINKMDVLERQAYLQEIANTIAKSQNLWTDDGPIADLMAAESIGDVDRAISVILKPECSHRRGTCDHAFPPWFTRQAQPHTRAFRAAWLQIERARP